MEKYKQISHGHGEANPDVSNFSQDGIEPAKEQIVPLELQEEAIKKLGYIYEFGTAYTALTFDKYSRRSGMNRVYEKDGVLVFWSPNETGGEFKPITASNIREQLQNLRFAESMTSIFQHGLMGRTSSGTELDGKPKVVRNAQEYKESETKNSKVYFNIVGRTTSRYAHMPNDSWSEGVDLIFEPPRDEVEHFLIKEDKRPLLKLGREYSANTGYSGNLKTIFRTEGLKGINDPKIKEVLQRYEENPELKDDLLTRFRRHNPEHKDPYFSPDNSQYGAPYSALTKEGLVRTPSDEGFELRNRIAPRRFQGLVIDPQIDCICIDDLIEEGEDVSDEELFARFFNFHKSLQEGDVASKEKHRRGFAHFVAKIMSSVNKQNAQNMIPIYDTAGNLVWPKEIPRDDVIKMTGTEVHEKDPYYSEK